MPSDVETVVFEWYGGREAFVFRMAVPDVGPVT